MNTESTAHTPEAPQHTLAMHSSSQVSPIAFTRHLSRMTMKTLFVATDILIHEDSPDGIRLTNSLPQELSKKNIDVRVVVPISSKNLRSLTQAECICSVMAPGNYSKIKIHQLFSTQLSSFIYLVEIPNKGGRISQMELSTTELMLFARAATAIALGHVTHDWIPDLIHCIGWKTVPTLALLSEDWNRPASIFSIDHLSTKNNLDLDSVSCPGFSNIASLVDDVTQDALYFFKAGALLSDMTTISTELYGWIHYSKANESLSDLLDNSVARLELINNQFATSETLGGATISQYLSCYETALNHPAAFGEKLAHSA